MIIAGAFLTGQAPRIDDGVFTVTTGVLNFVDLRLPPTQPGVTPQFFCDLHLVALMRTEPGDDGKTLGLEVAVQDPEGEAVDVFSPGGDGVPRKRLRAAFMAGALENELRWIHVRLDLKSPGRHVFTATLSGGSTASVAVEFRFNP
ncbi:hypothetical protein BH09ACT8_BH09ACT8_16640 [soil metagenome]